MEYLIFIFYLFLGAIFRRLWGGWFNPNDAIKRIIGFLIPLSICIFIFKTSWLDLIIPLLVLFGWLMPYHGYGIAMGRDKNHPLLSCIIVMIIQYGFVTACSGIFWEILLPKTGGLIYIPLGCMVSFAYYISWKVWEKFGFKAWGEYPKGNVFIDGPCAYAELMLGAILIGGIPLAYILAE